MQDARRSKRATRIDGAVERGSSLSVRPTDP